MKILDTAKSLLGKQNFDCLGYAIIDFKNNEIPIRFEIDGSQVLEQSSLYFDLASLTKPLTLAAVYHHKKEKFSPAMELLLNHRAGLPAYGPLSKDSWRDYILSLEIAESETLYSDYSALRLMLELESQSGKKLEDLCNFYWDEELYHWTKLPKEVNCPATGTRQGRPIIGEVNDQNAYVIEDFCSHAGLFSTVTGLANSLISLNKATGFIAEMSSQNSSNRFICGWDTPSGIDTLAGQGCGQQTFGHLGFTGTSIWIDCQKNIGQILLTNATCKSSYSRDKLNELRRELGTMGWNYR